MSTWDEEFTRDPATFGAPYRELVEFVRARVPRGAALDLGCGQGRNALWLAGDGWQVTAVDSSRVAIEQLRRAADAAGLRVDARAGCLETLEPEARFDLVLADMVLHHLDGGASRVRLAGWARRVRPGGVLCIVSPGPDDDAAEVGRLAASSGWELAFEADMGHSVRGEELTFYMTAARRRAANDSGEGE